MRLVKVLTVVAMVGLMALTAMAQNAGGGGGGGGRQRGGGGNFDPAQMRERMLQRVKDNLGVTDDEWNVIKPKVEAVQTAQMAVNAGRFGGGRGRGGPGGGGGGAPAADANVPSTPVGDATKELQTVLDNKDSTPEQIKAKLTALRDARTKAREQLTAAQTALKEVLTVRQEAILVQSGTLE